MRVSIMVLLGLVCGALCAQPICIPKVNQVYTHHWDQDRQEFAFQHEVVNFITQQFRTRELEYEGEGQREERVFHDILMFPHERKGYYVTVHREPGRNDTECSTFEINDEPVRDPCFTYNASHTHTSTIGGTLVVDNFYAEDHHNGRATTYSHIQITKTGIPVQVARWNSFNRGVTSYHNFATTLPSNAFEVPSACTGAKRLATVPEKVMKKFYN